MKRVLEKGETREIKPNNRNIAVNKECWSNNSVKIVEKVKCSVPKKIEDIMDVLNRKFPNSEFSIFAISIFDEASNKLVVQEDYYIPKQTVSMASVDYEEDAPEGFNTVIHKHPNGCNRFSSTDDTYINQNFDYSLLWVSGKFVTGQIRAETMYGLVALNMDILTNVIYPDIDIENIKNIKVYTPPTPQYMKYVEYGITKDDISRKASMGSLGGCEDYNDYLRPQQLRSYRGVIPKTPNILLEDEIPKQKLKGALLNSDLEQMYSSVSEDESDDMIEEYYENIEDLRAQKENEGVSLSWEEAVELYDKDYRINNKKVKIECCQ